MIYPIHPDRVRRIEGSFAFIEHRFLHGGFWSDLDRDSLLLYLFLAMVSDRFGLSYYAYDKICTLLRMTLDDYIEARDTLIEKDLIAFDGRLFQVLSLPGKPAGPRRRSLSSREDMAAEDPATIERLVRDAFGESKP